jgi:hypothetical protein
MERAGRGKWLIVHISGDGVASGRTPQHFKKVWVAHPLRSKGWGFSSAHRHKEGLPVVSDFQSRPPTF